MTKTNKTIYWTATGWLALGMLSSAVVQVANVKTEVDYITALGYPGYMLTLLGIWKILGVVALLIPRAPLVSSLRCRERSFPTLRRAIRCVQGCPPCCC